MENRHIFCIISLSMLKKIIFIFSAVILTASCSGDIKLDLAKQEEEIDAYITGSLGTYDVTRNNGSNRVVISPGSGTNAASKGDSVRFHYVGYIFSKGPGTEFVTDSTSVALGKGDIITGLDNGLLGVLPGEECVIIFSAKYGYYDKNVGLVPSMSPLLFHILIDIVKKNN